MGRVGKGYKGKVGEPGAQGWGRQGKATRRRGGGKGGVNVGIAWGSG